MIWHLRFKQGFSVHQHQMVTTGDQVLMVTVGAAKNMQDCRKTAGIPIMASQLFLISTGSMRNMFHIPIIPAGIHGQVPQRWKVACRVEFMQQRIVSNINTQIFWLVDNLAHAIRARRCKGENGNGLASIVRVTQVLLYVTERMGGRDREQSIKSVSILVYTSQ